MPVATTEIPEIKPAENAKTYRRTSNRQSYGCQHGNHAPTVFTLFIMTKKHTIRQCISSKRFFLDDRDQSLAALSRLRVRHLHGDKNVDEESLDSQEPTLNSKLCKKVTRPGMGLPLENERLVTQGIGLKPLTNPNYEGHLTCPLEGSPDP